MNLSYFGYFTPYGGYGIANFNWVKYLRRAGLIVYPHGKFMPQPGDKEWDVLNQEEQEIADTSYQRERIGIIETTPFDFGIINTEVKIANTMAESDILGKLWIKMCNKMDYIIVPNKFQEKVFLDSGVTSPVTIIPHGTECDKFPYYDRPDRDTFTFGIAGWLDTRKGVFDLIQAFVSEFGRNEPVQLLLKTTNPAFGFYKYFTDPRITTINKLFSPEELNDFYQSLDCFVFPSKAEGIGQPPREAMATGLPVILTKYSGLEEIALDSIAYPLQPRSFLQRTEWAEQPGRWANVDITELMYQMRYIYEHQKEAKFKGQIAALHIRKYNSWENAASKMKEFLSKI